MKIDKIIIKNFKSIGASPFTYDFKDDEKFTLIKGKPGEGKTTILSAIYFGFYGKSSDFKGNTKTTLPTNKLVNDINKKEMLITIHLSNGYTIKRGIAPSVFDILDKDGVSFADKSSKTIDQEFLEKDILKGLTPEVFMTTVYLCSSPSSIPFLYMPRTQKKDYIEKLLDLDLVSYLDDNLKEYITSNKLDIQSLENKKDILTSTLEREMNKLKRDKEIVEQQKKDLADFENNRELRIQEQLEKKDSLNNEKQDLMFKRDNLKTDMDILKDKYKSFDEQDLMVAETALDSYNKQLEKLKDKMTSKKMEKDAFESNKSNYSMCGDCKTLEKIIGSYDIEAYNKFQDDSAKAYKIIKSKIAKSTETIESINEIKKFNKNIDDEMSEYRYEFRTLEDKIKSYEQQAQNVEHLINSINNEVKPMIQELDIESYKILKKDLDDNQANYDNAYNESQELKVLKDRINDKEHKVKALQTYLPLFESKLNELLSRFLIEIEFDITAKLENDFELTFFKNGKVVDIFGLSSGQKSLITLAVTFSFLYLLEIKHKSAFQHLLIDEILDISLGVYLPYVIEYIKELSVDKHIDIISHNTSIPYEMFDKIVTVEKTGPFSEYIIE